MHKIRITQNFTAEKYLFIIVKLEHVLASPLGHHQIVKQNICFTYIGEQNVSIPYCVICYSTISNHLVNLSFLLQHVKMKYGGIKHKSFEYFQRKLSDLPVSKGQILSILGIDMKAVEASYKVSFRIAKAGKSPFSWRVLTATTAEDMTSLVVMLTVW